MTKNSTKKIPRLRFKGFEGEWEEKRLGDLINYNKGYAFKTKDVTSSSVESIPIIKISNLVDGHVINNSKFFLPISLKDSYKRYIVNEGDILITTVGSWPKNMNSVVGKVARYDLKKELFFLNQNIVDIRSKENKVICNNYLYWYIYNKKFFNYIISMARGNANQASITLSDIFSYSIYYPTSNEQNNISLFLNKLDRLIDLQYKKVEQLKKLKRGYLQKMFPQKGESVPRLRFDGFSGEWEEKLLSSVTIVKTGKSKYINHNKDATYMYPILGSTNIIGYDSSYDYNDNFVLVARVGNAGNIYCFSGKVKITDNTIYLPYNYPLFLSSILNNYNIKFLSFGSGRKLIKSNDIKKIRLTLPSYDEQNNIEIFIKKIMKIILVEDKKLSSLRSLKKSYLQKIFC